MVLKKSSYGIVLFFFVVSLFLTFAVSLENYASDQPIYSDIGKLIQKRIAEAGSSTKIKLRGERLRALDLLEDFYKKRNYQPAWVGVDGPSARVEYLIDTIREADLEGLVPAYYHLQTIITLLGEVLENREKEAEPFTNTLADLELLLTDAYLLLGCHFSAGCVNPNTIEAEWFVKPREVDVTSVFERALKENRIKESLHDLLPPQDMYGRLRQKLTYYRELAAKGGWPTIAKGKPLKRGVKDDRVIQLRERLVFSGYLSSDKSVSGAMFDDALEKAVIMFQKLHGLKTDGIVGHMTLKALSVPAETRARQIEINMERMRWISRNLGQRYIKVNIADFTLDVVEKDHPVLSMKVVVGKPFWHTPVFSAKMTHLVLNPSWNVPRSIAIAEIIPKIQKNMNYLKKENMKVIKGWEDKAEEIDTGTVDWETMNADTFNYRLRQEPGPLNPLGQIKFMFPNQFGVYLHDTPSRGLFERNIRSFSHGCIRLEKPLELAEYVLKKDPKWTRDKIVSEIKEVKEKEVGLPEPIDVHILYLTAWVDENSFLNFRDDIYGRDKKLDEALEKGPPAL